MKLDPLLTSCVGVLAASVAYMGLAMAHGSGAGIVALPDYPHGVVICGEATVINEGHEADPEVAELLALAAEVCPQ